MNVLLLVLVLSLLTILINGQDILDSIQIKTNSTSWERYQITFQYVVGSLSFDSFELKNDLASRCDLYQNCTNTVYKFTCDSKLLNTSNTCKIMINSQNDIFKLKVFQGADIRMYYDSENSYIDYRANQDSLDILLFRKDEMNIFVFTSPPTEGGIMVIKGNFLRIGYTDFDRVPLTNGKVAHIIKHDPDGITKTLQMPEGIGIKPISFNNRFTNEYKYSPAIVKSQVIENLNVIFNGSSFGNDIKILFCKMDMDAETAYFNDTKVALLTPHKQIKLFNVTGQFKMGGWANTTLIVDGVKSTFPTCIAPTVVSTTSVSKYLGGQIIVRGSNFNLNSRVWIGQYETSLVKTNYDGSFLYCTVPPGNFSDNVDMPFLISIQGCNNTVRLVFNYNDTIIHSKIFTQNDRIVTLTGKNYNDNLEIKFENDQYSTKPISILNFNTTLILQLPFHKCNSQSFTIKDLLDNSVSAVTTLSNLNISIQQVIPPSTINGVIKLGMFYIPCPFTPSNVSSTFPIVKFNNNIVLNCTIPEITPNYYYYTTNCQTPKGTGDNHTIKLSYMKYVDSTNYSYANPIVDKIIFNNNTITIIGSNFGDDINKLTGNITIFATPLKLSQTQIEFSITNNFIEDYYIFSIHTIPLQSPILIQKEVPQSTDTPTNLPTDTPTDIPTDTPTDTPTETPTDTPTNTPLITQPPITQKPDSNPSSDTSKTFISNIFAIIVISVLLF